MYLRRLRRSQQDGGLESAAPWLLIRRLSLYNHSNGGSFSAGRGRRTSSPPQLGQMAASAVVHSGQKVHS